MSEQTTTALVPEWDVADRMRKALRISGVGVQEMADYLGVARNTVSTWINGRIEPGQQTQRLWALRCGVPYEWLKDGTQTQSGPPRGGEEAREKLPHLDSNQEPAGYRDDVAPTHQERYPTAA
jgi:transcriptional regulator with XRE-family HTH domain